MSALVRAFSRRQRGVALIIGLVLLMMLTMLAATGLAMAVADLKMAGNEQFHRQASDAASAGIEAVIAELTSRASSQPRELVSAGEIASADFVATARYVALEQGLSGYSADRFAGLHYEIESTSQGGRNAVDEQVEGVMLIASGAVAETFVQSGSGLQGGAP